MDLIAAVADGTDLSRAKAGEVVDAVFGAITGALKAKEEVRLSVSALSALVARPAPGATPHRRRCDPRVNHGPFQPVKV
jgi:hypothetical protein